MLFAAVTTKDANVAYVAPTYGQARDIAWEILRKRIATIPKTNINESRLEVTVPNQFGGHSKITLKGWESVESLRGQSFHFLVLDEVAMYRNFISGWQEVIRPTLTDHRGRVLFISTPKGFNFWYDLFNLQRKDKDYKSFTFTSYNNPHVPSDEIDKARLELHEDRFAQEYMADFRKTEGLVYREFDRERHVFSDPNVIGRKDSILIGIDWGFTNPAAVLEIVRNQDRNYFIKSEWYKARKTTEEITEYAATLRGNAYYPDPAEPDRILELERRHLNVREVVKDVSAGIDTVRNLFKQDRLYVHDSCVNLINELETYSYAMKKPDKNEYEEPIKENDHAVDALRYVLHMQEAHQQANTGFRRKIHAY